MAVNVEVRASISLIDCPFLWVCKSLSFRLHEHTELALGVHSYIIFPEMNKILSAF